mgnify:CR=1 FL=1
MDIKFFDQLNIGITVCDREGKIIYMNEKSKNIFKDYGDVIGKSLLDCHPETAKSKLKNLMEKEEKNVYTIEKNGIKKLIFQSPFYIDGKYSGFYELSLEIPFHIKHFNRNKE